MNLQKLLISKSNIVTILISAAILTGCGKQNEHKNYVAKVNDTYLTNSALSYMMDSSADRKLYRSEIIRNWVNREVLYQEASSAGILNSDEYKRLQENSNKELAVSLLLKKKLDNEKIIYEPKQLEKYFEKHKTEFQLFYNAYLFNKISFSNEDKAVQFRSTVLESDWNKASTVFNGDTSLISMDTKKLKYGYEVQPGILQRVIRELYPRELSIVINDNPGSYTVLQLIEKYNRGVVPPLDVIRDKVEARFAAEKKEKILREYIKEIYSNNDIEVKN